jgi:hypothetical protein
MNSTGLSTCPQCGAYARNGKTCGEKYEEILAIEYEAQTEISRKMNWSRTVLDIRTHRPEIYIEDIRD